MTETIRLTAAQALVRWLSVQHNEDGDRFIDGVWGIFGHGNVAGLGEALNGLGEALPTWRGQNEQTMALRLSPLPKRNAAAPWRSLPRSDPGPPTW